MTEIRLPIPLFVENLPADIEIKLAGDLKSIFYRIESFSFYKINEQSGIMEYIIDSEERNKRLKNMIETYDKSWKLIQIFAPLSLSKSIQLLFRKK